MQPSQDDTSPEESIHGGPSIPDWQARNWEDEEYTPPGRDYGAGSTCRQDPMAALLDGLPGFITEDIDVMLHDLPLPDALGMTVGDAIQVLYNI